MRILISLCLSLLFFPGGVLAANPEKFPAPIFLAEQDRNVAGAWPVRLALEQTHIETRIDLGRIANNSGGGGLIGALIITSHDNRRQIMGQAEHEKAEAIVAPLRSALQNFDVDALALSATKAALAKSPWFQAQEITATKDASPQGATAFLASAPQVAFISYRYELSPDFSQICVIGEISLAQHGPSKDAAGSRPNIIFRQRILSVVQLRSRSYEPRENVVSWSAGGGKLTKSALTSAFGQFGELIPYALGLSQSSLNGLNAKNHEKVFAAGFYGPLIAKDDGGPDDVLIWSDGLVHVHSVP